MWPLWYPVAQSACITVLAASVCTDLAWRRIPNSLTFLGAACGIVYQMLVSAPLSGLVYGCTGVLVGCLMLIIPWLRGWTGAGDAKLLGTVGAWLGPCGVAHVFLYGTLAGGILGLFYRYGRGWFYSEKEHTTIPYALAILCGYIAYIEIGPVC